MRRRPLLHPPSGILAAAGLLLLLLSWTAPPAGADAVATALLPPQAALDELPGAVALAIQEAENRLTSDQAQARLALAREFVSGFDALPPGQDALADPAVRAAYSWTEDVVVTTLAVPLQLDAIETAGAACRATFANVTRSEGERTVTSGLTAGARLQAALAELDRLAAQVPAGLDATPVLAARGTLAAWSAGEGTQVRDCLEDLAVALDVAVSRLDALVLPDVAYRTQRVRVVGSSNEAGTVRLSAPSLGIAREGPVTDGTFTLVFDVARGAGLGNHTLSISLGDLTSTVRLEVRKAPVMLLVEAPQRVGTNQTLLVHVTVASPLPRSEVDRVPVQLMWQGTSRNVTLAGGVVDVALPPGPLGPALLVVRYPGSDVLLSAEKRLTLEVVTPSTLQARAAQPIPEGLRGFQPDLATWWIMALALAGLFILALIMSPVWLHRARGWRSDVLQRRPGPLPWPGSKDFVGGVAQLFALLARRRLAPPGRTVREWIALTRSPSGLADRFDEVRYGAQPESEPVRRVAFEWLKAQWRRWQA